MCLFRKNPKVVSPSTIITIPGKLRISLCEARYFTEKEMGKVQEALCILSFVLNSDEFHNAVLYSTYTTTRLAPRAILDMILQSNEDTDQYGTAYGDDNEMDLVLSMYMSRFSKVVGYTLPEGLRVWINRKFFTYYSPWEVAGNMAHEWLHNLGFDHSSASDSSSVPYLLGNIIRELGHEHYSEAIATRKPLIETIIHTGSL